MLRNTKLLGVIAGILIAALFMGVQYAEAQEITLMIEGENKDYGIFIAIEGNSNIIMWDSVDGYSEHFDGELKTYKSGGFSLKNPESGIAVWGSPMEDATKYKLVILTSKGVERIVAGVVEYTPLEEIEEEKIDTDYTNEILKEYWENRSTDYTRPADVKNPFMLDINYMEHNSIFVGDEYTPTIKINDRGGHIGVPEVEVIIEISRNNGLLQKLTGITDRFGTWNPAYKILYPPFIPSFCYQVEITANYLNHTASETDDFLVTTIAKYWKSNTGEYTIEPQNIPQDYDCND